MPTITSKKLPQNRTQFTISFSDEEVAKAEQGVIAKLSTSVKIPGFREGKAPADMVKEQLKPEAVFEEIVRTLAVPLLQTLPKEHTLKPIIVPKLQVESAKPLKVAITYVERPNVSMKGADKIKIGKKELKADEKDVERMVQYLLRQEQQAKEVEREAKEGDQVTIDFHGTDKEGTEVAGIRTRGFGVVIGSKTLLPGFEEALTGMKRSDEKKFELTFPKDYHAEHLREKPVTFHTTVTKVEEVTVPAFDDDFAKKHGLGESAPAVRERIGASLKEQELAADRERRERELFEAVRKATKVDLAPELIEETERGLFLEFEEQLQRRNVSLEDWLKQTKKKPEDLGKEMHEQAEKRLQLRFGVEQMLADRKIEVSDEEIQREIKAALAGAEPAEKEKAAARFAKGTEDYEQLVWRKKVEKLVEQMLAA